MEPFVCRNVDMSNPHVGQNWIYVGLDLGERVWVAGWLNMRTSAYRLQRFDQGDVWRDCLAWLVELGRLEECRVHVLYEVGRQGFELARQMRGLGIEVGIVAVSRFCVGRGRKRGKSDRLDARRLTFMDWTERGFPLVWVPSRQQEGLRNRLVWEESLERSLRQCRNRGLSILARWGVRYDRGMSAMKYERLLKGIDVGVVGEVDGLRLASLWREEEFLRGELAGATKGNEMRVEEADVAKLMVWRGLGEKTARVLTWYVGDWGRFGNGRSFSAYCGLTSVHVRSSSSDVDKGISHAGHRLLRRTFGQLAVLFLRWQPECELVKATAQRVTNGKAGRLARTALARQLAVALWKWMVHGEEIRGASRALR